MNSMMRSALRSMLPLAVLSGCAADRPPVSLTDVDPENVDAMNTLAESNDPLRDRINAATDQHQFLAILSPT